MKQERKIIISGVTLEYTLDCGKRKNLYLYIIDGKLVVRAPLKQNISEVERVIAEKSKWIIEKTNYKKAIQTNFEYKDGEIIFVFGEKYKLKILQNQAQEKAEISNCELIVYIANNEVKIIVERYLDNLLNEIIREISSDLIAKTNLTPNQIALKKMSRSFGRCNTKKNIVFSKRLVHYPQKAIEYVVLHELCHLKFMDQSANVWGLVSKYMPDYKQRRDLLR